MLSTNCFNNSWKTSKRFTLVNSSLSEFKWLAVGAEELKGSRRCPSWKWRLPEWLSVHCGSCTCPATPAWSFLQLLVKGLFAKPWDMFAGFISKRATNAQLCMIFVLPPPPAIPSPIPTPTRASKIFPSKSQCSVVVGWRDFCVVHCQKSAAAEQALLYLSP